MLRGLKGYLLGIGVALSICIISILNGVVTSAGPKLDIIQRWPSPDSLLEIVQVMPETGATDGFVNWLYVIKRGAPLTGEPVFIADRVDGDISLIWDSNEEITIKAKSARIFKSGSAAVDVPGGTRNVALRLDITYPRAP